MTSEALAAAVQALSEARLARLTGFLPSQREAMRAGIVSAISSDVDALTFDGWQAIVRAGLEQLRPQRAVPVWVHPDVWAEFAGRTADGRRVSIAIGEPDEMGFFTPTFTVHELEDAQRGDGTEVFEVRYDDGDAYHVAGRFTSQGQAATLRDRLATAHQAADQDGCHLDDAWTVVPVEVDDVAATAPFPADLFELEQLGGEGHADVNIDRLPLAGRQVDEASA